jgi:hypothetical protein
MDGLRDEEIKGERERGDGWVEMDIKKKGKG